MPILAWILIATFFNSLLGLIGSITLWIKEKLLDKVLVVLISFSGGALLGGAFFHLLDESLEHIPSINVFEFAVIGFVLFFFVEGYFHSHFCKKCKQHPFTYMMLIGDSIHNFIDGLVIAAAFFTNPFLGIIATLMILGHEAPQEMGLFGVLVYGGYEKKKALLYSYLAQSTCILGGLTGYFLSSQTDKIAHFLVPFAAGGFIYLSASDLVPEMHKIYKGGKFREAVSVVLAFIIGILLMLSLKLAFE